MRRPYAKPTPTQTSQPSTLQQAWAHLFGCKMRHDHWEGEGPCSSPSSCPGKCFTQSEAAASSAHAMSKHSIPKPTARMALARKQEGQDLNAPRLTTLTYPDLAKHASLGGIASLALAAPKFQARRPLHGTRRQPKHSARLQHAHSQIYPFSHAYHGRRLENVT